MDTSGSLVSWFPCHFERSSSPCRNVNYSPAWVSLWSRTHVQSHAGSGLDWFALAYTVTRTHGRSWGGTRRPSPKSKLEHLFVQHAFFACWMQMHPAARLRGQTRPCHKNFVSAVLCFAFGRQPVTEPVVPVFFFSFFLVTGKMFILVKQPPSETPN